MSRVKKSWAISSSLLILLVLELHMASRAQQGGPTERKAMIDRSHALPIAKQAKAL
jgi:hypothetical protein